MEKHEHCLDNIALIVFAKTLDSPVKTRIARTEGKEVADRIYRELLKVTAETINGFPYYVAFAGGCVPGELTSIFTQCSIVFSANRKQPRRSDGKCLPVLPWFGICALYRHRLRLSRSEPRTISCRRPWPCEQGCNVVLGPVSDGGYHLAGVDIRGLEIFKATAWSTTNLMKETLLIVEKRNLRLSLQPMRYDIDTFKDYCCWKSLDLTERCEKIK